MNKEYDFVQTRKFCGEGNCWSAACGKENCWKAAYPTY